MSLYEEWNQKWENGSSQQLSEYMETYYEKEKLAYTDILKTGNPVLTGTVMELAERFQMEPAEIAGFLEGINTSLEEEAVLSELEENTAISVTIVWEKLYFNMLKAKAPWLYELSEWDGILSSERRGEITKEYRASQQAVREKVGRNDPCPCGSGKKYKKCCESKES